MEDYTEMVIEEWLDEISIAMEHATLAGIRSDPAVIVTD
jgi:hypothetical protein